MKLHRFWNPTCIGILSARHQQHNAIDKFVLVGDYKQLPGHWPSKVRKKLP